MKKLLIPLIWFGVTTLAFAQTPENIFVPSPVAPDFSAQNRSALPCNFAGTFTLGPFFGQSNDTDLDTIYLCFGDSILIDHNGDFDLSNDPIPASPNGIAWAFYDCPPTVAGDNLQAILADPCLTVDPVPTNGIWIARGAIDGDITFRNLGVAQNTFNSGGPVILHFAPITIDDWGLPGYDSLPGLPPGPCVNVNTAAQFAVAYLNAITESDVSNSFQGDDCLGYFQVRGGLPELLIGQSRYTIEIALASNPEVKALTHLPPNNWFSGAAVPFSVSEPGVYTVSIEDGKSCGLQFQIDMSGCDASDNVTLVLPDTVSPPGSTICVPIGVNNFDSLVSATFNLGWNPAVLEYIGVQNANPVLVDFDVNSLNEVLVTNGLLGVNIFDLSGEPFSIPGNEYLFEVCFNVVGALNDCTLLYAPNNPAVTTIEGLNGIPTSLIVDSGQVCVDYLPLEVIVNLVDTMCVGGSIVATLNITTKGGIPPYQFTWQQIPGGAVNNGTILNDGDTISSAPEVLGNGTYIIRLTDENGLGTTVADTLVVNFPTLGATIDLSNSPTCFGLCDGQAVALVTVDGSVVPNPNPAEFTFAWTGAGVTQGLPLQDSLCAGNYSITVTQVATGCTAVASGTLSQPTRVQDDDVILTPASCTGTTDGTIEYLAQGGVPFTGGNYNFNWTYSPDGITGPFQDQTGVSNPSLLVGKAEGFYYVTITDANGCTYEDTVQLGALRTVELTATVTNVSCTGSTDGVIELAVTVTPSDPGDFFFFNIFPFPPGAVQDCQTPLTCTISQLPPGIYSVLVIDAVGCLDTLNVEVLEPAPLVVDTFSFQRPSCVFQNDGAITVIAFGGTGSPATYQYIWENGAMGPSRNNLPPGMYAVTVTDLNGCQDSLAFDLQLPEPPTITGIDSVPVQCGSDGCLTVLADTLSAVTFTWLTIDGNAIGNTQQVCSLSGNTYIVIVGDNKGCESVDTVDLGGVDSLVFADTMFILPSCFGYPDGRIGVTVAGGTMPYGYAWNDPKSQNNPTIFDLMAGDYTVTVTDINDCTLVGTFTLEDPPAIQATYTLTAATCADTCNGSATPVVQYSDGAPADFNFVWCDGSTDSLRLDLCPGTCYVTIVDAASNCFLIDSVVVPAPDTIGFDTLYAVPASCFGLSDGEVGVQGNGGNGGPFQYLWSVNNEITPVVTDLPAGDYTVTITDAIGCTAEYTTFVTEPAELIVVQDIASTTLPICFGDANGQIGVSASGGNPGPYAYVWADSSGNTLGMDSILSDIPSGEYFVTVTDVKGCTGTLQNLVLNDPPPIVGSYLPLMDLNCNGDETTLFIDTIFGGSGPPYQYSLDFGVLLDPTFPISIDGGQHFITYYDRLNCEITDTIQVFEPDPLLVIFNPDMIEIKLGDTLTTLQPQITGSLVDTFFWTPGFLLSDSTILNPMVQTFMTTTYTLTVFDSLGCMGEGSIIVEVDPDRNVYIPNVVFPGNTSGLNSHFGVGVGLGVEIVNFLQIFDRWGGLIYERTNFLPEDPFFFDTWDGRYNGEYVNPGVYVYVMEVKFLDGRVLLYRGDVTVVR